MGGGGAVQSVYKDTEMILRERDTDELLELFYFCYSSLTKTYLKEYSVYVLNNLCSPAPSSGVTRGCGVASHTNASPPQLCNAHVMK